jgi:hypothetical protein
MANHLHVSCRPFGLLHGHAEGWFVQVVEVIWALVEFSKDLFIKLGEELCFSELKVLRSIAAVEITTKMVRLYGVHYTLSSTTDRIEKAPRST